MRHVWGGQFGEQKQCHGFSIWSLNHCCVAFTNEHHCSWDEFASPNSMAAFFEPYSPPWNNITEDSWKNLQLDSHNVLMWSVQNGKNLLSNPFCGENWSNKKETKRILILMAKANSVTGSLCLQAYRTEHCLIRMYEVLFGRFNTTEIRTDSL